MADDPSPAISRRTMLLGGAALAVGACSGDTSSAGSDGDTTDLSGGTNTGDGDNGVDTPVEGISTLEAPPWGGPDPFVLGVASGDPDQSSVVLWTRLIGAGDATHAVACDISVDEDFRQVVASAIYETTADVGHSFHIVAADLEADAWYYFRFRAGQWTSDVGRTRTLPASGTAPSLRFGFSSCQNWETGTYVAHRHLAQENLDLMIWLGDYIYEYGPNDRGITTSEGPRVHDSDEATDLDGYRSRYALYKSDPNLRANHAARPWLVTWDDHEVDNNYAGLSSEDEQDVAGFTQRRLAAQQAWWEHMPVRLAPPTPQGFDIHRRVSWGSLADLHVLDGRQHRSPQPTDGELLDLDGTGGVLRRLADTAQSTEQTMLGLDQRTWLLDGLSTSTATWNVLANQVFMHGLDVFPGDAPATNIDTWDGYHGERKLILETAQSTNSNLIVLTGDFHAASAAELRTDPYDRTLAVAGTEFMAPAVSSQFPAGLLGLADLVIGFNPQIKHFDPKNGYMTCELDAQTWVTELHIIDDVGDEGSAESMTASFTVRAGEPGIATVDVS